MDKRKSEEVGIFGGIAAMLREEFSKRKNDGAAMLFDVIVFAVSFVFARYHVAFGTYPAGLAFIAALPRSVFTGLFGCVVGALTLGKTGVISAVIAVIVVVLRIIISGGGSGEGVFRESSILRISSVAVGSFISAVYEMLLSGFSLHSVLSALLGVLLSALICFVFLGLFDANISFSDVLYGSRDLFSHKTGAKER